MNNLSDNEIIEALIRRDEKVTKAFFEEKCRPLFMSIIKNVFDYKVDYEEVIGEIYLHLMENDAHRLRLFKGESSLPQYIKIVALRYLIRKRDELIQPEPGGEDLPEPGSEDSNFTRRQAAEDLERLFAMMKNDRYVFVIYRLMIDEAEPEKVAAEMGIKVSNLYNIKKRAMNALVAVALKDKEKYVNK